MKNAHDFDLDTLKPGRYRLTLDVELQLSDDGEDLGAYGPQGYIDWVRYGRHPGYLGAAITAAEPIQPELVVGDFYVDNFGVLCQVRENGILRQLTGVGDARNAPTFDFTPTPDQWAFYEFRRVELVPA